MPEADPDALEAEPETPPSPELDDPSPPEPTTRSGLLGQLPRFPSFPTPRPRPEPRPDPAPSGPPGPSATELSSPASTEPKRTRAEEVVDLHDLQAAVREVSDIAFVGFGQVLGMAEKRAKGLPAVDDRWKPTKAERKFVNEPAARIAKRHMHADVQALDTIDALLIAAGVGGFTLRRAAGVDPLEDE